MTVPTDVHRNAFGTIDFDHYRRVAAHIRTEAMRGGVHAAAGALGHTASRTVALLKRLMSLPASRPAASPR